MPAHARIHRSTYPNGLTLITEELRALRSLSLGVWVRIGSRHELPPREAGASHFLEHMLFKGTLTRSAQDIARAVDEVGGEFNAFTSREQTCFHLLLLDRQLKLGGDLLTDVVLNSQFAAEELERERRVILQEISMVDESPEEIAHDLFFEKIFQVGKRAHGIGRPILGTRSSIQKMSRKELLHFFTRHYRPENLVLCVAGNVTHAQVKRVFAELGRSRRWPGRKVEKKKPPGEVTPRPVFHPGGHWVSRRTEQVHLLWGVEAPRYDSKDRAAMLILNNHFGGGMSSRLFQEIREKRGLSYTVYSHYSPYTDTGVLSVYLATKPTQVALSLKIIEEVVHELRTQPLTDKDLELARENLKGMLLLQADSAESRMSSLARGEILLGQPQSLKELCDALDGVSPRDLLRVARKYLRSDRAAILGLGQGPPKTLRKRFKRA